jgi:hypothetical protein
VKKGKVVVIDSNNVTVQMHAGSTGDLAMVMAVAIGLIGVFGAVLMCQAQADYHRRLREPRELPGR